MANQLMISKVQTINCTRCKKSGVEWHWWCGRVCRSLCHSQAYIQVAPWHDITTNGNSCSILANIIINILAYINPKSEKSVRFGVGFGQFSVFLNNLEQYMIILSHVV